METNSANTKTLVVGDMHLREKLILDRVSKAASNLNVEKIVFCGDYVDNWYQNREIILDELTYLRSWVKEMRKNAAGELEAGIPVPDIEIEFVVGNHDMQYLRRIPGAGTFVELYDEVAESLNEINVKAAATVGDYLITHAGVTGQWAKRFLELEDGYTARSVCAQLNKMFEQGDEESLAALSTAGARRGGKDLPGPLWADGSELCDDPLPGINQIVGHTPLRSVKEWRASSEDAGTAGESLFFCDTFSLTRGLMPIGDGNMVLVEDDSARKVTPDEAGIEPWTTASWKWLTNSIMPFLNLDDI